MYEAIKAFNSLGPLHGPHGRRSGPPVEKIHLASNDLLSVRPVRFRELTCDCM
jgi:hypothetical protein